MTATDGRQLRAARAILGLTVVETAEIAGLHRNSVLRAEGQKKLPRQAHAANLISKAFEERGIVCDRSGAEISVRFDGRD